MRGSPVRVRPGKQLAIVLASSPEQDAISQSPPPQKSLRTYVGQGIRMPKVHGVFIWGRIRIDWQVEREEWVKSTNGNVRQLNSRMAVAA